MKKKKVVVYCRVSTDHDDQKNSLENQRLFFEDYVEKEKNWDLVGIYADEGISGTSLKRRNQFNKLIRDAHKKSFDIILTKEVCRFARNTVDTLEKTRELKRLGIEVKFIIDNISTFDTDGELRLTIMAGMAQDESRRISERTQFGVIQSMKKGVAFGNIVYGYDYVRDEITGKKTKLVINEEEAKVVRQIFNSYLNEGKGAYSIAKDLKEKGVKIKRPRNKEESTDWRNGTILDILKNEKYVGDLKQRKTYTVDYLEHIKKQNNGEVEYIYIKNHHPPIISRELFDKVQVELKRRSDMYSQKNRSKYSNKHTFSGKLVCGICSASYVGGQHKERKDGTQLRTWRCYTGVNYGRKHIVNNEEVGCNNDRVNDLVLKQCFSKALAEIVDNKEEIKKDVETILRKILKKTQDDTIEVDTLENEKIKLLKQKEKLLDLCLEEVISSSEYKRKSNKIEEQIENINVKISEQNNKIRIKENIDEIIEKARREVNKILSIKEFSKSVCKEVVDKVVIHSKTKFDFYLRGINDPYFFEQKGNILSSYHW